MNDFRSWAEIDTGRLVENVNSVFNAVSKDIFAVVKADAYGHGAVQVSQVLQRLKPVKYLCVATAEEGKELKEKGIKKGILVLGGILPEEVEVFREYGLVPVVSDFDQLKLVEENGIKKIHLKFDTGMHRLGFLPEETEKVMERLKNKPAVVEGVMSHFPSADWDREFTQKQIKTFAGLVRKLQKGGINPRYVHLQNSAGLEYGCDFCNSVRIGISLYGSKPSDSFPIPIKTVMSVKAKVITVKKLKKGEKVSYGGTFTADRDMEVAVVSFGYADGLPRALSNRGYFLIKDRKVRILGTI
ncbi:MAG: alanine racemase, partial [Aquificae bacterium]|nr:alanine racemase [Aquificota bacterium]